MSRASRRPAFLGRLPYPEYRAVADALRAETVGGVLLLVGAVAALVWANSPWSHAYESLRGFSLGPAALHLHLPLEQWAADGLLAVFFFVAGVELKRELVVGELRDRAKAILPVIAATCGMVVPALVYALVNLVGADSHPNGWAIPTATDIAFALAVLAVVGTGLPSALRAFLLTLAVVDDLLAIIVIAVFYSESIDFGYLAGAVLALLLFGLLHRAGVRGWYVYVPLALVAWGLMHASGVHATVAGVVLGMLLRVRPRPGEGPEDTPGAHIEHLVRPWSAGLAVPVFAFLSAGVSVGGAALGQVFTQAAPLGVVLGLVVGKAVGVFGGSWVAARFTRATLNPSLAWADVAGVAVLAGIGFTVSLLIGDLAFPDDPELADRVKAAVLVGSVIAALLAAVLLRLRGRVYRRLCAEEERDTDADGIPDIYQDGERDRGGDGRDLGRDGEDRGGDGRDRGGDGEDREEGEPTGGEDGRLARRRGGEDGRRDRRRGGEDGRRDRGEDGRRPRTEQRAAPADGDPGRPAQRRHRPRGGGTRRAGPQPGAASGT